LSIAQASRVDPFRLLIIPIRPHQVVDKLDILRFALFTSNEASELRARWDSIQVGFVDEPRKAVQQPDALVAATM
jgi:hypothetical protein